MFDFLTSRAERKIRNRRAARMLLREHGDDALLMLDKRIDRTKGRDRAHWKRVRREASYLLSERPGDEVEPI